MLIIIAIVFMILSYAVSAKLKNKFRLYAQLGLSSGLSGKETAERMLRDHNIYDVQVLCHPGELTDHYNPANKTVNLSEGVYHGRSAAAVAVAAHECGHAVQHATAYSMLRLRTALVPVQNLSGKIINMVMLASIFGGMFLWSAFPTQLVITVIVGAYAALTLFALVTLPVEFDASKRALAWVGARGIVNSKEHTMAKDALRWAAMTYVVAAVGSLVTLLYWVSILMGSRE
jgi:Zn-dependent membrane protease YugP